jgi:DNA-binding XRE family transcriptional regulator
MQITHDHPTSSYGIPVILDDSGEVVDYQFGIRQIRRKLKITTREMAAIFGGSMRTVENWENGAMPGAAALNAIGKYLSQTNKTK